MSSSSSFEIKRVYVIYGELIKRRFCLLIIVVFHVVVVFCSLTKRKILNTTTLWLLDTPSTYAITVAVLACLIKTKQQK